MTLPLPPHITAATAMDALTQSIENMDVHTNSEIRQDSPEIKIMLKESWKLKSLQEIFECQHNLSRTEPAPSLEVRIGNLKRLKRSILKHAKTIEECASSDFGNRASFETQVGDLIPVIGAINYTLKNIKRWMAPAKRKVNLITMPAVGRVEFQPVGVVGIISPWNYPVLLSIGPLVAALAAGNRVMIKVSELSPKTSALVGEIVSEIFGPEEVYVVQGEVDVSIAFSALPWDHLLFTGSTAVGRIVMRAASENLTPVTLELGGKSPAIISEDCRLGHAVKSILLGKVINAGQSCVAPDYVLCPEGRVEEFASLFERQFSECFASLKDNDDYASLVSAQHRHRLLTYIKDAKEKGARVIECNPANETFDSDTTKIPLYLILDSTEDMLVRTEEIFGPILVVIPVSSLEEAITFVNDRDRPLALYFFGRNRKEARKVLDTTVSGGVCINDTMSHFVQEDLHVGGIGPSGMGSYHGHEGFLTFSHKKAIIEKSLVNGSHFVLPPYGGIHKNLSKLFLK